MAINRIPNIVSNDISTIVNYNKKRKYILNA
jgi:hypothetical protein